MNAQTPLLEVQGVHKHYHGVSALQGVSIQVQAGSITGLIGPNGSGKSTLFDCITGFQSKDKGTILLQGQDISQLAPHQIARQGLRRTFQQLRFFPELTVREHLLTAAQSSPGFGYLREIFNSADVRRHEARMRELAHTVLRDIRLEAVADHPAAGLSYGQKKLMELGMALMTQPKLLMLDEPSLGLAPFLVAEIFDIVKRINQSEGLSVLLVEQNAIAALEVVSHGYLIENGRIVMHDTAEAMKQNPDIQEFYLGGAEGRDFNQIKHYRRRKRWLS